jgi:lysophospholipase L1-like esterase
MTFHFGIPLGLLSTAITTFAASATPALWEHSPVQKAEPVLFLKKDADTRPAGRLLYKPAKLLRAYLPDQNFPVADFEIRDREIIYTGTGKFPALLETELFPEHKDADGNTPPRSIGSHIDGKHRLFFTGGSPFLNNNQICFDYEMAAGEKWDPAAAPPPVSQAKNLPHFHAKLAAKADIIIGIVGDSISAGCDASGKLRVAPNLPPFVQQFADHIARKSGCKVTVDNKSYGGAGSSYAMTRVRELAGKKPTLLIIGFGMNDASGKYPAPAFAQMIKAAVDAMKKLSPETEYILISGMAANPCWNAAREKYHHQYDTVLKNMAGEHIAVADVLTPWLHLADRKGFMSLTSNGVNHPNDYGHRLYADVLMDTVMGNPKN